MFDNTGKGSLNWRYEQKFKVIEQSTVHDHLQKFNIEKKSAQFAQEHTTRPM